jgi:hypothetical protein
LIPTITKDTFAGRTGSVVMYVPVSVTVTVRGEPVHDPPDGCTVRPGGADEVISFASGGTISVSIQRLGNWLVSLKVATKKGGVPVLANPALLNARTAAGTAVTVGWSVSCNSGGVVRVPPGGIVKRRLRSST